MKIRMMVAALSLLSVGGAYAGQGTGIQLCDNLKLDDDSVHGWGCWTTLDPTAAGPTGGSQMDAPTDDAYRTLPAITQTTPAADGKFECPAGAVCGYTAYWNFNNKKRDKGPYPAYFVAYPEAGERNEGGGNLKVRYTLVQINPDDPAPRFENSGKLTGWYSDDGYGNASREGNNKNAYIWGELDETGQLVFGWQEIYKYVEGQEYEWGVRGVYGPYVAGIQTPADAMAKLTAAGKTATYTGYELNSENAVKIKVNFGLGTWNGTWDHQTANDNVKTWNATGTISGSNIQSDAISGHFDHGQVQGSFYGPKAKALAGVADVYRVKNNGNIDRHVDVFATTTSGFSGGGRVE